MNLSQYVRAAQTKNYRLCDNFVYSPSENEGAVVGEAAVGEGRVGGDSIAV